MEDNNNVSIGPLHISGKMAENIKKMYEIGKPLMIISGQTNLPHSYVRRCLEGQINGVPWNSSICPLIIEDEDGNVITDMDPCRELRRYYDGI